MEVSRGGVLISLSDDDARALGNMLVTAIRLGWVARGQLPPALLRTFADEVSRAARSSARFREDAQASSGSGTARFCGEPYPPFSEQPVRLTVREAATLAEVSEGYMRRCCRRGDVTASQERRGWAVDIASLGAWIGSRRRTEQLHQKAA